MLLAYCSVKREGNTSGLPLLPPNRSIFIPLSFSFTPTSFLNVCLSYYICPSFVLWHVFSLNEFSSATLYIFLSQTLGVFSACPPFSLLFKGVLKARFYTSAVLLINFLQTATKFCSNTILIYAAHFSTLRSLFKLLTWSFSTTCFIKKEIYRYIFLSLFFIQVYVLYFSSMLPFG